MRHLLILLAVFALLFSATAAGQGKGKGKGNKRRDTAAAQSVRFLPRDTEIIVGYYHSAPGGLPPGLAKRGGDLPPGLAKQLRRNGQLPPGLQKKITPFPADLEQRLPPLMPGYRRVVVDRWAMLIYDATNVIMDVIDLTRRR